MKKLILPFVLGIAVVLSIAATRIVTYGSGPTLIQKGTAFVSSDGTVTQAFATAYSVAPVIVTSQVGLNTTITNILTITTSNFILRTAIAGSNTWVAIGTP